MTVVYRQQRDRYAVEIDTPQNTDLDTFLEDVFRMDNYRIGVLMSVRNPSLGTYTLQRLESTLYPYTTDPDAFAALMAPIDGLLQQLVRDASDLDSYVAILEPVAGDLHEFVIIRTLYDIDAFQTTVTPNAGTLVVVVILHTLFDIDEFQTTVTPNAGTLVVIVISHTLFDIDQFQTTVTPQAGTLA